MTITQYIKKDGTKAYMFKVYLGTDPITNKQRHTTRRGFKTKKDASIALAKLKTEIDNNGFLNNQNMTFKELYELWLPNYKNTVKESTFNTQKGICEYQILPRFENMLVSKITTAYCQKIANDVYTLLKNYSNFINLIKRILQHGVHLNIIRHNPMDNIIKPKKVTQIDESEKFEYYTREELKTLLEHAKNDDNPQTYIMLRLLAYTGMRKGEMIALKWSDIDFSKSTISITKTLADGLNGAIFQTPKSKSSYRIISIDADTLHMLKEWKIKQANYYGLKVFSDNYVLLDENSNHVRRDYPNYYFYKLIKKHNLKKINIHGFRHTHCSLLFESGASIQSVKERLGHSNIQTTMNIYTHVTEKTKDETAQNFAKYINF